MAHVQVIQRHAHLAGAVKLEFVNGREGKLAKAVLIAISNQHRGSGEDREERAVSIRWTLWGKQAEHAAEYLGKGSHVNLVGRLHNNNYQDAEGGDRGRVPGAGRIGRRRRPGRCGHRARRPRGGVAPNRPDLVVAFLGAMRLGAIWVGVSTALAPPEQAHLLRDSGARLLPTTPEIADTVALSLIHILRLRRTTLCISRWSPYH